MALHTLSSYAVQLLGGHLSDITVQFQDDHEVNGV